MKLVISCFSCSPGRGSEPGMGWNFVLALSKYHELWVLVDGHEFREVLTRYVQAHAEEMRNVHFQFVDCLPHPFLRRLWPPSYYWFYNLWHRRAFKVAKRLHQEIGFDAAYKLNMVTFREPGYLWKLPIPFIWGPVGALGTTDPRLFCHLGMKGRYEFLARNIINTWQQRTRRRSRLAAQKAAQTRTLIAANGENQRLMKKLWNVESDVLCEIGVPELISAQPRARAEGESLRLAWSGLFEVRKALPILLEALSVLSKDVNWRLDVVGDGPCRTEWVRRAKTLGLNNRITWHGWIKKEQAEQVVGSAHVLVITSIHDLTSTVLLEALGKGVPVISIDHCGFSDVVTPLCGIKVPISGHRQLILDFADSIQRLSNESTRLIYARGAQLRAQDYLWSRKECILKGVLERIIT